MNENDNSFELKVFKITKSVGDLLVSKNKAYGNAALSPIKVFSKLDSSDSIRVRIDDKLTRIANVGINEDTEDTLMDLIGYLILLKISLDKTEQE
jgi:hypothetical protein